MERPFAITLTPGSSRANHTGAWRTERPVYVHNLPPCNDACPAGENVQQWLYHAEEGDQEAYENAWRQIMADNPFPAIMGRVCYRPCETACNRGQLDEAVGINSVERFLGDEAINRGWKLPVAAAPTGKRVLVVGAGPSGLSAAYHLTRLGHSVTIKDAGAQPGGMMRYGIPKYRLPRDILDAEIGRVLDMGVTLELNTPVTDILAELTERPAATRGQAAASRPPSWPSAPTSASAPISRPRLGQDHGRGVAAAPGRRRLAADARPPGRRLRRREHRHGRGAHRAQARRGRGRRGLPPHQGPDARARHRGGRGAGGRRHDALAVHGRARRRRQAGDREDAAGRDRVPAADGGVRGAGGGLPGARARPGRRPGRARRRARRDVLRRDRRRWRRT